MLKVERDEAHVVIANDVTAPLLNRDLVVPPIDEFRVNGGVHVDQYPVGGKSLRTVGGDSIAVVEVPHLRRIKTDATLFLPIHLHVDLRPVDSADSSQIAVGNAQLSVCRRELDTVALREVRADLPVGGDTVQSFRVVGDLPTIFGGNRNPIGSGFNGRHGCVAAWLDAVLLASPRVIEHITLLVVRGPISVNARQLRSLGQNFHAVVVFGNDPGVFQLYADGIVDVAAAGVVGRNDKRVLWLGGIVPGDGFNALPGVRDLNHAALLLQQAHTRRCLVLGKMLDDSKQFGIFLTLDLVKLGGLHPGLLHLLEGLAGIHALMLASVPYEEDPVLRPDLLHETLHLAGAGETGFIEQI
jgi:hypothetical protein